MAFIVELKYDKTKSVLALSLLWAAWRPHILGAAFFFQTQQNTQLLETRPTLERR